jgi:hypothetical protein
MAPLNHRYFVFLVYFSEAVALVIYNDAENTKSLGSSELVWIGLGCCRVTRAFSFFLKSHLVEGV